MQTIIILAQALIGICAGLGVYNIMLAVFKAPSRKTVSSIRDLARNQQRTSDSGGGVMLALSTFIAQFVRLSPTRRKILEESLFLTGISVSPELYTAQGIAKAGLILLLAIPVGFILPILAPVMVVLAVLVYMQNGRRINALQEKRREEIELDLTRFVYSIQNELRDNRDVLSILERAQASYSSAFAGEIGITVADMRTGNYEAALQRLDARNGSTGLSEVVRGLIDMVRGNDTHVYWESLAIRFSSLQKELLRKEANKVPGRIRRLSFILLLCMMGLYVVVLGYQMLVGIQGLF